MKRFTANTIASPSFSNCEYFFLAGAKERDAKAIGFSSPLSIYVKAPLPAHMEMHHRLKGEVLYRHNEQEGYHW